MAVICVASSIYNIYISVIEKSINLTLVFCLIVRLILALVLVLKRCRTMWIGESNVKRLHTAEKIVSVLHQDEGGIGKSIPDARKISQDPRDFPRAKPEGNLEGRGKSGGPRGWISQYLPYTAERRDVLENTLPEANKKPMKRNPFHIDA